MEDYSLIENFINDELSDSDAVSIWNEYCDKNRYNDNMIYDISMLDDMMVGLTPTEILKRADDINIDDDYFWDTLYGVTSGDLTDSPYDVEALAKYIVDNDDDLYNAELRDFLDEEVKEVEE